MKAEDEADVAKERAWMPTCVAAELVGLGCGGRVDVERVELADSSKNNVRLEDRRGECSGKYLERCLGGKWRGSV